MVIRKNQTTKIAATPGNIIWDYPMPSEDHGVSYQELDGPIPETGWYRNTVCHELFYIIEGTATMFIDDKKYEAGPGDVVILTPNQKHKGVYHQTKMITVTSPNWYEKQCERVEDTS